MAHSLAGDGERTRTLQLLRPTYFVPPASVVPLSQDDFLANTPLPRQPRLLMPVLRPSRFLANTPNQACMLSSYIHSPPVLPLRCIPLISLNSMDGHNDADDADDDANSIEHHDDDDANDADDDDDVDDAISIEHHDDDDANDADDDDDDDDDIKPH